MNFLKNTFVLLLIVLAAACAEPDKRHMTIFYTADEHGWLNDSEKGDGAAALMELWKEKEGYTQESDSFLVLSGGDMWTGSSVSTLFEGYSMVEIMNNLGYDAAALGNHEFDFSIDTLITRAQQSAFPFLAANLTNADGSMPEYAIPYTMKEVSGVTVGILGLANVETPATANPSAVADLVFAPYAEALRQYIPEMEQLGADFIIIVGHICKEEMEALVPLAKEFNIPFITGGHCHSEVLEEQDGVLLMETSAYLTSYIKVELEYDVRTDSTTILSFEKVTNNTEERDEHMAKLVNSWDDKADAQLGKVIGYTAEGITRNSSLMQSIVADAWFSVLPDADLVMVNKGGVRQDIEKGDITLGTILGLLPFNNEIVKMTFTGEELLDFLSRQNDMHEQYMISGTYDKKNIKADDEFVVLTTNYLYSLDENKFKIYDPNPLSTGIVYREPSIAWVTNLKSSADRPLETVYK